MNLAETLEAALEQEFQPTHLEIVNESHMHNVAPGSESHFKVVLVCAAFEGKPLVARHRSVNSVIDMSKHGIHALALHTYAPSEWVQDDEVSQSPDCLGGNGK